METGKIKLPPRTTQVAKKFAGFELKTHKKRDGRRVWAAIQ
jgi:hypothetical protein